jgi:hypothetical protein
MAVLSYEEAAPPTSVWLARLICGLAIANGAVSVGYVAASRIPGANVGPHAWTDVPVVICGLALTVFGALGVFRVSASRLGIFVSAILLILCSWIGQWVSLRLYGPPDYSTVAYALVGSVDNAVTPTFLVLCLIREPVKGYFNSHSRLG